MDDLEVLSFRSSKKSHLQLLQQRFKDADSLLITIAFHHKSWVVPVPVLWLFFEVNVSRKDSTLLFLFLPRLSISFARFLIQCSWGVVQNVEEMKKKERKSDD